jgi:hypothetical protein
VDSFRARIDAAWDRRKGSARVVPDDSPAAAAAIRRSPPQMSGEGVAVGVHCEQQAQRVVPVPMVDFEVRSASAGAQDWCPVGVDDAAHDVLEEVEPGEEEVLADERLEIARDPVVHLPGRDRVALKLRQPRRGPAPYRTGCTERSRGQGRARRLIVVPCEANPWCAGHGSPNGGESPLRGLLATTAPGRTNGGVAQADLGGPAENMRRRASREAYLTAPGGGLARPEPVP